MSQPAERRTRNPGGRENQDNLKYEPESFRDYPLCLRRYANCQRPRRLGAMGERPA